MLPEDLPEEFLPSIVLGQPGAGEDPLIGAIDLIQEFDAESTSNVVEPQPTKGTAKPA